MLSNFEKSPFSTFVYSIASLKKLSELFKSKRTKREEKRREETSGIQKLNAGRPI
ncbi:MAG: hypothetical protein KC652_12870 [Cyanobacteria bacterium HKST-UBA01]|nr:hypothetical protein [Cyanobacteria bacterium HKST-UBA01]